MEIYAQLIWNILFMGLHFAMMAASFSMIFSVTQVIHVAHGGVIMAGGYFFYELSARGVSPVLSAIVAIILSALLGWLLNEICYERLRSRRKVGTSMMIASVALLIILQNILLAVWSSRTITIDLPFTRLPSFDVLGAAVSPFSLLIFLAAIITFIFLYWLLTATLLGKAMRAVADQEQMAEVCGIDAHRVRQITFLIGSAIAGLAGVLAALLYNLEPSRTVGYAVDTFSFAIVGGIGSIFGAFMGSLLLWAATTVGGFYIATAFKSVFAFLIAFVILLVRPQGLFGKKRL